jgi:peptidylprolyl isomerase
VVDSSPLIAGPTPGPDEGSLVRRLLVFLASVAALVAVVAVYAAPLSVAAPAGASTAKFDAVTVTGAAGERPVVTVNAPFGVKTSTVDVINAGKGVKASKGSTITFDYVLVNGRTGQEIESSFGTEPVSLVLDPKQAEPTLVKSLIGTPTGSRVLVAIAPKDGLAKAASGSDPTIQKDDTLLFLFDVRQALKRAEGQAVAPVALLPTVELAKNGAPTITMPKSDPPTGLVAQPLIKGTGPVVTAGQKINVQYTGALWRNGKVFDSSWKRGESITFPIGTGDVVAGWDEGLVGQTVGSQVLLVVPPDKGYGPNGQPQAGINGTDTMVFVVDILGAA